VRLKGPLFALGVVVVGCGGADGTPSVDSEPVIATKDAGAASELDEAMNGTPIDPGGFVGTYDVVEGDSGAARPDLARFILLPEGTALTYADGQSKTAAPPRRPFQLVQLGQSDRRALVIHTSSADKTLFRAYAIERPLDAGGATSLHELRADANGPRLSVRRLPCSETLYQDKDADHACAYYACKIAAATSPADRCAYFTDFGLPYCKKFYAVDFEDRAFGRGVRQCLQEAIRDEMEGATCDTVQEAAIASHVDCYVASGFCTLSLGDRLKVFSTIDLEDWTIGNGLTLAKMEEACAAR
jgi:hypothetical protein